MAGEEWKGETWTIMVYQAGDNNLTDECVWALTEMKQAKPSEGIRIFTQFDPEDDYLPTQRFQIPRPSGSRNVYLQTGGSQNGSKKLNGSLDDNRIGWTPYWPESNEVIDRKEREKSRRGLLEKLPRKVRDRIQDVMKGLKEQEKYRLQAMLDQLEKDFVPYRDVIEDFFEKAQDHFPQVIPGLSTDERNHIKDTDSGSPDTLFNFISYCLEKDPRTDRYMLVLSGHAGGTEEDFLLRDSSPNSHLTFKQLRWVFDEVQKVYEKKFPNKSKVIDILGLDACLMSMAEISYELHGAVDIMVGCESYSPAAGWPYRQILDKLNEEVGKKSAPPQDVASFIVGEYVNFYVDYAVGGLSVDQSAVDVNKVEKLTGLICEMATALEEELHATNKAWRQSFRDAIIMAHWEAQSYNGETSVDLYDFCNCLQKRYRGLQKQYRGLQKQYKNLPELGRRGNVGERCRTVMKFIKESYVLKSCFSGPGYQYSYGVSIYFPWSGVSPLYANLEFASDSGWGKFLQTYVKATRRLWRRDDGVCKREQMGLGSAPNFMRPFRMVGGKMVGGKMVGGKMVGGKGENPMHSMRNPPIVTFPSHCIREENWAKIMEQNKLAYRLKP